MRLQPCGHCGYPDYGGRLDASGIPADTRTPEQKARLEELLWKLHKVFPQAIVAGHGELTGVKEVCPSFPCDEYRNLLH